jgi:hypothetical protein
MDLSFILLFLSATTFLVYGLAFSRPRPQANWKSYLAWEAVPILQLLFFFALIASINWPYESKLLIPRVAANFVDSYLGPILLALAVAFAVFASSLLFALRLLGSQLSGPQRKLYLWIPAAFLGLGTWLLIVGSASTVLLGPAAMTMRDRMTHVPNPTPN